MLSVFVRVGRVGSSTANNGTWLCMYTHTLRRRYLKEAAHAKKPTQERERGKHMEMRYFVEMCNHRRWYARPRERITNIQTSHDVQHSFIASISFFKLNFKRFFRFFFFFFKSFYRIANRSRISVIIQRVGKKRRRKQCRGTECFLFIHLLTLL